MKNDIVSGRLLLITASILLVAGGCKEKRVENILPRIDQIDRTSVSISWETKSKSEGTLVYRKADKTTGRPSNAKDTRETAYHSVQVTDLLPGTLYSYWIKDSKTRFTFRTEPEGDRRFSFLLCRGGHPKEELNLAKSEECSFLLTLGKADSGDFREINAFVPILSLTGKDSLHATGGYRIIGYGNLALLLVNEVTSLEEALRALPIDRPAAVILQVKGMEAGRETLLRHPIHASLAGYAGRHTGNPLLFAAIVPGPSIVTGSGESTQDPTTTGFSASGVNYFFLPPGNGRDSGAVVLTVEGQASSVYFPGRDTDCDLSLPAAHAGKTCLSCNRLGKRGEYRQSIGAFTRFIRENGKKFRTDQAYYSVARIYEENLFDFAQAGDWYSQLADSFPMSDFQAQATERVRYLKDFSGGDYTPLQEFEKIRQAWQATGETSVRQQSQRKPLTAAQEKLLDQAEEIARKYPNHPSFPLIMAWIADCFRYHDPGRALNYYDRVNNTFPEFSLAHEIPFRIAETYLDCGRIAEARESFRFVKKVLPQLSERADAQLDKIRVRTLRSNLSTGAWSLGVVLLLAGFLFRPAGIRRPRMKILLFTVLGFIYSFGMFFIAAREEITEDFNGSVREILWFFLAFTAVFSLSLITARTYTLKLSRHGGWKGRVAGSFLGLVVFMCGFYLTVYYIYPQYLSFINL
ncbi:MAG TPA: hypothetical protein PKG48_00085 [Bacteroidales bacterium]|nr:hypothetical protein [Bacteroidales bacterium]HPS62261.1 hypothetical protein [Bacteroidales bacterium]